LVSGRANSASILRGFPFPVAMILLVAFLLLVGCGGGGGGGQGGGEDPIRLGVILPYSGVYAQLGEDITDGMNVYFEEQGNEIAGRPVELIQEDTEADPQVGVEAARTLIERDEVAVLTGTVSSAVAYGVIDLVSADQIPFVISNATGNDATRRGVPYVFRTSASSWQVSYPMGQYLVDNGVENVYVTAPDYAAGQEQASGFREGFAAAGGNLIGEAYPPLGNSDYSTYLTNISQASPQAEWSFYAGTDAVNFVRQYAEAGLKESIPLYGSGYMVEADTIEGQGEAAAGVRTGLFYASGLDNPENTAFIENFQSQFERDPSTYAVQGYDAAWLIGEALKATEGDTDPDALVEAMESVEFASPRGPLTLDENHNPIQNIYIREAQEQNGTIENVVIDTIEDVQDPGE